MFLKPCNFIKKETLAQLLSCQYREIYKNTFLQNTYSGCFCNLIIVKIAYLMEIGNEHLQTHMLNYTPLTATPKETADFEERLNSF